MNTENINRSFQLGHNPYFNRWFSAINMAKNLEIASFESQSLF